jgi:hypothetical protein
MTTHLKGPIFSRVRALVCVKNRNTYMYHAICPEWAHIRVSLVYLYVFSFV